MRLAMVVNKSSFVRPEIWTQNWQHHLKRWRGKHSDLPKKTDWQKKNLAGRPEATCLSVPINFFSTSSFLQMLIFHYYNFLKVVNFFAKFYKILNFSSRCKFYLIFNHRTLKYKKNFLTIFFSVWVYYKMVEFTRKKYDIIGNKRGIIEPQKNDHSRVNVYS